VRRPGPRREERTGRPGERPERPGERSSGGGRARAARPQRAGWTPPDRGGWQPPERGERRFSAPQERPLRGRGGARGPRRFEPNDLRPRPSAPPAGHPPEAQDSFAAGAPSDLIWGRHAAEAALESGRPLHRIWCTPELRFSSRFLQRLREAKASGVLVEEVTWARLGQISGGAVHQGIVLQPAAADTLDLGSLIEGCRQLGEPPLLIAVDGLTDPQNLGAIVRSAEALGAHGMVLPQRRNAGLTGSVAKVAAGALEHLPVARVVNLNRSLEALQEEGYRVIGLAEQGSLTLEEADLDGPLVVVTGSEADGLSMLTRRHCDQLVRIPLRGVTPSLNASVATALLLYEVARRGWMRGLRGAAPAPRLRRPATAAEPPSASGPSASEASTVTQPAFTEPAPSETSLPAAAAEPAGPAEPALPADSSVSPAAAEEAPAGEILIEAEEPLRFSSDVSL
jgi:23S rRNA (guanosine2251-2'-O)-methyltransferase